MASLAGFALIAACWMVASATPQQHCEGALDDDTSLLQASSTLAAGRGGKLIHSIQALGLQPDFDLSEAGPDPKGVAYLTKDKTKKKGDGSKAGPDAKESEHDPKEVVQNAFTAFQEGKFKGAACKDEATKFFTADAVIDTRGPQDTSFFKKYSAGLDGVCEYFSQAAANYKFRNFTAQMYTKDDRVLHVWEYIPEYAGTKSEDQVQQFNVFRLDKAKTRIAAIDALFDKPSVFDKLTYGSSSKPTKSPQMDIVADTFRAFANKSLEGDACQQNIVKFFTNDSTIDMRGPEEQQYFKKFGPGAEGVCQYWTGCYGTLMRGLNASMYARGDDVVLLLDYMPEIKGEDGVPIEMPHKHLLQYNVIGFNKDKSKCKDFDVFLDKPFLFNSVAHPPEPGGETASLASVASEERDPKWTKYVKPILAKEEAKTKAAEEQMGQLAESAAKLGSAVASAAR